MSLAIDNERRTVFFRTVFGTATEGYVCIARRAAEGEKKFLESYFLWPKQAENMYAHIEENTTGYDLWFCPQLLVRPKRAKDGMLVCTSAWADLDECSGDKLRLVPTLLVESSPNRYQAYWRFSEVQQPTVAEDISRRIAYAHADDGCDKSGWDLTQLLRIPYTFNFKYPGNSLPVVTVKETASLSYTADEFYAVYPQVDEFKNIAEAEMPEEIVPSAELLMRYRNKIHPMAFILISQAPKQDWSKSLWNLELLLFECGLKTEEVYSIALDSACNKYERDHRGNETLWKEVVRAYEYHITGDSELGLVRTSKISKPILTAEQKEIVEQDETFVERYIEWASKLGDASRQYHQAGAFIILSSLLSGVVRIPTSFGTMAPNLWFMILADTTLTRKTTAMDIAMSLVEEVDDNVTLATDGSIEGIFQALSTRPARPSIFLRDEFSGLLEAMTKREYMAGMAESLTKLYDGKPLKRVLRRDTIDVREPCLLVFAGGIKSRIFQLLNPEHVISGFLPRFLFITAESDVSKLRPVGPPTAKNTKEREDLVEFLQSLKNQYDVMLTHTINGNTVIQQKRWLLELTPEAWSLYNHFEAILLNEALDSVRPEILMPCLDRLSKSGLKAAALIACSRTFAETVTIEEIDILHAFYYVEQWKQYLLQVLQNIEKTEYEKLIDLIVDYILNRPGGVNRSEVMRTFKLTAREAEEILTTMEQRSLISRIRAGKGEVLTLAGGIGGHISD